MSSESQDQATAANAADSPVEPKPDKENAKKKANDNDSSHVNNQHHHKTNSSSSSSNDNHQHKNDNGEDENQASSSPRKRSKEEEEAAATSNELESQPNHNDDNKAKEEEEEAKDNRPKATKTTATDAATAATTATAADASPKQQQPLRPIKKARTAYFMFAEEQRPAVQKQHAGEGVAVVAKALGQLWNALTPEQKQVYQQQAALDRERVAKETEAWNKAHGGTADDVHKKLQQSNGASNTAAAGLDPHSLAYPTARVRKICRLDPEVRGISKEALLLVSKAAELATAKLGRETVRVAALQNRRKLKPEDVALVCRTREPFFFLKDDVKDLVREQQEAQQKQQQHGSISKSHSKAGAAAAAPTTSNPITSYFSKKE